MGPRLEVYVRVQNSRLAEIFSCYRNDYCKQMFVWYFPSMCVNMQALASAYRLAFCGFLVKLDEFALKIDTSE